MSGATSQGTVTGRPSASIRWRARAALVTIALIWGATFVVIKDALCDISTFLFLTIRFWLAAALMAVALHRRLRRRSPQETPRAIVRATVICGGLLFLGFAFQTAGLRLTSSSNSAFITGLYIVLVPLLGSIVHKNRPRVAEVIGAALATLGTALMTNGALERRLNAGDLLTVCGAFAFAAHILAVAYFAKKMSFERLSLLQVVGVAVGATLVLVTLETPRVVWSPRVWIGLGTTSVLCTALSFFLYTWAQQRVSASHAALVLALEPVFAGLAGVLVAGEKWTAYAAVGASLILSAIVMVEMKPSRAAGHPQL